MKLFQEFAIERQQLDFHPTRLPRAKMTEARRHHYVPKGYLKAFAEMQGDNASIFAINRYSGKSYRTSTDNVANIRDFNRIDVPDADPNALEIAFSKIESSLPDAVRRIEKAESLANEDDRFFILNFIALLAARNPRTRDQIGSFIGDVMRKVAEMCVSTKQRWQAMQEKMKDDGSSADISYEDLRDFIKSDGYNLKVNQTYQISLELGAIETILKTLVCRKWVLLRSSELAGDFVTSDHPVCLLDISGKPPRALVGVGFGLTETSVLFPIGSHTLISGTFEGTNGVKQLKRDEVARINSHIIFQADRHVFSYDDSFNYYRRGEILGGRGLVTDSMFVRKDKEQT